MLSRAEAQRLIAAMPADAMYRRMVELMYGTGLRVSECCQRRVCDIDFDRGQILVRAGKGKEDRATVLPLSLVPRLRARVEYVRLRHERDVQRGAGYAPVPTSLEHKRHGAARELRWQFVFGSAVQREDAESGQKLRWHAHPGGVDRAVKLAADAQTGPLGVRSPLDLVSVS